MIDPVKGIAKAYQQWPYRYRVRELFADSIEAFAISISNAIDHKHRQEREARYMEIVRRYDPEVVRAWPSIFAQVVNALADEPSDILGQVFHELEANNKAAGQFFTPNEIGKLMAFVNFSNTDELQSAIDKKGYVSVSDPACGSGALLISSAIAFGAAGFNYQTKLHITATDIDRLAVHMVYIQLSLLHIPAIIIHGNSLSLEEHQHWFTPAHIIGCWDRKLARTSVDDAA